MQAIQQKAKVASKKRATTRKSTDRNGTKPSKTASSLPSDDQGFAQEAPLSAEDKERLAIVLQIQEQIVKRGDETMDGTEEEFEIERLLHGYVSMCHNSSMEFMKSNQASMAGRMLNQCQDFIANGVPPRVAQIVLKKAILHTVFNNLAQHANMVADMNTSIQYLEKALIAAERPEADQDLLPLAETYLNLANGYSFLNKYDNALEYADKALRFAGIRCNRLREEINEERSKGQVGPSKKIESLDYQLNDFIAIKIMANLCVGEQHEKLCCYNAAIKSYAEGKQFAETNFGTRHSLYTRCVNAMGGARLKSKYQTKEVYRAVPISDQAAINKAMAASKAKKKKRGSRHEDNPIKSKLMAHKMQDSSKRRNIKGMIDVSNSMRLNQPQDNLLLSNCDSWSAMHCGHIKPRRRESLLPKTERKQYRNRRRSLSVTKSEKKFSQKEQLTHDILLGMTESNRAPYQVKCKIGPTCKNHNWNQRSPLKKVCTRGPGCANHDWDASRRSSFGSTERVVSAPPALIKIETQSAATLPIQKVVAVESEIRSNGNHSCMLQQTERVHQQQMQHMRTMQEDQFKMLQLVIENSQQKHQTHGHSQLQMYQTPQMYMQPQLYQQGGYPSTQFQQPWFQGGHNIRDADASCTETEQSEFENIQEGKRPQKSELSQYEQIYALQQQQIDAMETKMANMQEQYQQQIEQMTASHEAFKFKSQRAQSANSDRRVNSYKDFKEDSDLNERGEDVLFGQTRLDLQENSQKSQKAAALLKDQSVQVMDSLQEQNSVLKHSTIKSKISKYRTDSIDKSHNYSIHRSNNSPSNPERPASGRQSSFKTEKSYRIPYKVQGMSRQEAATKIQKNFKGYRERQDFRLVMKRGGQKMFLFRATVRGKVPQIISCSAHLGGKGQPIKLSFILHEARRPQSKVMTEIDLKRFYIHETTDLKNKVMRIIRDALTSNGIITAIKDSFKTELAREILEANFYSSDDQFASSAEFRRGNVTGIDVNQASTSSMPEIYEEQVESYKQQPQVVPEYDSQTLIDAELERIRKRCEIKQHVNVEKVVVKDHEHYETQHEHRYDDYEIRDRSQDMASRFDHEEHEIKFGRADVRRTKLAPSDNSNDEVSQCCETDEERRQSKIQVVRKLSLRQIVQVQAMVRGFLSRLYEKMKRHIIYCKILRRDDQLVRFTLSKNSRNDYSLRAEMTLKRNMMSKRFQELPFSEDDAKECFERCLVFSCDDNEIKELDLKCNNDLVWNQLPVEEMSSHNFILDYDESQNVEGENLIKSWLLRDEYPCKLFVIKESSSSHFRVTVTHQNINLYLTIRQLPVDMIYMAYYLNNQLNLAFNDDNVFSYLTIQQLLSKRVFQLLMDQTEVKFFGQKRSSMPDGGKPLTLKLNSSVSKQKVHRFETTGDKVKDFVVNRHDNDYVVEVFDETEQNGKFKIKVKRRGDESDTNYISVPQVTLFIEELVKYLKENLKIELKSNGSIDYISLAHSYTLFNEKNLRRISEAIQAVRNNSEERSINAHSNNNQKSFNQSQQGIPASLRVVNQLSEALEDFTIERNNRAYTVSVSRRKNVKGQPLQITVTSQSDNDDSKFMVFRNQQNLLDGELMKILKNRIAVYLRYDEVNQTELIDYISLSEGADVELRNSSTMSLNNKEISVSKRNMVKARAGKLRDSLKDIDASTSTINQDISLQSLNCVTKFDAIEKSSLHVDSKWMELTSQIVKNGNRSLHVHLYGQLSSNRYGKTHVPRREEAQLYKILIVGPTNSRAIASVDLSVPECDRLLKLTQSDLHANESALFTINEIMEGNEAQNYNKSQLEQLRHECAYPKNKQAWNNIIKNVSCTNEKNEQVKFDVWSICQSQKKLASVSVSSKLSSQHNQRGSDAVLGNQSYASHLNQAAAIDSDSEHNSRLDGGDEGCLSEHSVAENDRPLTQFRIVPKARRQQQQRREENLSSSSQGASDFPLSDQDQEPQKCQSIVKTADGQFLYIMLTDYGQNFYLMTVTDSIQRNKKFCDNFKLPQSFLSEIDGSSKDRLNKVKLAVEELLKTGANDVALDGHLDTSIFN